MGYADPLYRSAALQVSQRALASGSSVHTVITDVKNKLSLHIPPSSEDLNERFALPAFGRASNCPTFCLRVLISLLVEEGASGWSSQRTGFSRLPR